MKRFLTAGLMALAIAAASQQPASAYFKLSVGAGLDVTCGGFQKTSLPCPPPCGYPPAYYYPPGFGYPGVPGLPGYNYPPIQPTPCGYPQYQYPPLPGQPGTSLNAPAGQPIAMATPGQGGSMDIGGYGGGGTGTGTGGTSSATGGSSNAQQYAPITSQQQSRIQLFYMVPANQGVPQQAYPAPAVKEDSSKNGLEKVPAPTPMPTPEETPKAKQASFVPVSYSPSQASFGYYPMSWSGGYYYYYPVASYWYGN